MRIAVLFSILAFGAGSAAAQRISVAAGYTRMPGQLGNSQSDHGPAVRVGIDLLGQRRLTWRLEGGVDRLNEVRRQSQSVCILPGGSTGTCSFDQRNRDTGWSLGTFLRFTARPDRSGPYALAGLGVLTVRDRVWNEARDSTGTLLPNFSVNGTSSDGALQGHLGAGFAIHPPGSKIGIGLEGRATALLHNYSGGLQWNWSPTVLMVVRVGR